MDEWKRCKIWENTKSWIYITFGSTTSINKLNLFTHVLECFVCTFTPLKVKFFVLKSASKHSLSVLNSIKAKPRMPSECLHSGKVTWTALWNSGIAYISSTVVLVGNCRAKIDLLFLAQTTSFSPVLQFWTSSKFSSWTLSRKSFSTLFKIISSLEILLKSGFVDLQCGRGFQRDTLSEFLKTSIFFVSYFGQLSKHTCCFNPGGHTFRFSAVRFFFWKNIRRNWTISETKTCNFQSTFVLRHMFKNM